jgi:hypothetical protein
MERICQPSDNSADNGLVPWYVGPENVRLLRPDSHCDPGAEEVPEAYTQRVLAWTDRHGPLLIQRHFPGVLAIDVDRELP